ncbi:MAG: putative capsular polysaccharide synthesis family protein [Pseudomonadota bacterium]
MLRRYLKRGEQWVEKLSKLNYNTAKLYYHYTLRRADRRHDEPPLLVFQMGKVGSKSVVSSLAKAGINRRTYHVHFLDSNLIEKYEIKRKKFLRTKREGALKHIWQYSYLRKWIEQKNNERRWKIVTLVRDPVARNLATFFENIEIVSVNSKQEWNLNSVEYDFQIVVKKEDLSGLIELFFEKCRHDTPLVYYDREFRKIFDIDVYASDFPTSKGYEIYQGKNADVLLIRLEDLNRCASTAFKELMDIDDFSLLNKNLGDNKDYADLYKDFKDHIHLPDSYLDKLYKSKFSNHFYSEVEISSFRNRWTKK